jgi:hypothetical protein
VVAVSLTTMAFNALPASAMTSHVHDFAIPGVYGVRAWGAYAEAGTRVRVTVCVEDTARGVYGAAVVGLAFDSRYRRHDNVSAVTVGYHHTQCRASLTRYTSHLVVEALSGYKNGKVRQRGKLKRIY